MLPYHLSISQLRLTNLTPLGNCYYFQSRCLMLSLPHSRYSATSISISSHSIDFTAHQHLCEHTARQRQTLRESMYSIILLPKHWQLKSVLNWSSVCASWHSSSSLKPATTTRQSQMWALAPNGSSSITLTSVGVAARPATSTTKPQSPRQVTQGKHVDRQFPGKVFHCRHCGGDPASLLPPSLATLLWEEPPAALEWGHWKEYTGWMSLAPWARQAHVARWDAHGPTPEAVLHFTLFPICYSFMGILCLS